MSCPPQLHVAARDRLDGEEVGLVRGVGALPHVLLIDNYDSYTFNLYHQIGRIAGRAPVVVRHDEVASVAEIRRRFSHVVISPGPGHPADPRRIGRCLDVIRNGSVPVLGVCLGHQAIATAHGGTVTAVTPRHGRMSRVYHDGRGLLRGVPSGLRVVRYHSLAVTSVGEQLQATAHADDGVVMAIQHRQLPLYGVQFHPESVCAEHGDRLVRNFLFAGEFPPRPAPRRRPAARATARHRTASREAGLVVREAPWRDPEDVFAAVYAGRRYVCWLDCAAPDRELSQWSYLGAPEGPRAHVVRYDAVAGRVYVDDLGGKGATGVAGEQDIFDFLRHRLAESPVRPAAQPFGFTGGYLGYLGYGAARSCRVAGPSDPPDAAFAYVDRFVTFDHGSRRVYVVAVAPEGEQEAAAAWAERTVRAVRDTSPAAPPARDGRWFNVRSGMDIHRYHEAYREVQRYLRQGDSYEVNLTFRIRFGCTADHLALYRHLRRENPAPFGAFLRLPGVSVMSSSPERFLRIDPDGRVEARPIKGTARRYPAPEADAAARWWLQHDEKSFTENLMVTDLLRNDLGQVCQIGTVEVPDLMVVRSYATVHQLVTTVRGVLEPAVDPISCVQVAFPGGSMTGAPKLRTMEIIDEVEDDARGVYSGALGYFSLSGHVDLSIIIRTIVAQGCHMSVGVGGGVVAMSDPDDEQREALLKAAPLLAAVAAACGREEASGGIPRWMASDQSAPEPGVELPIPATG